MGRKPKKPACDRDCFNCPYPDCINNDMSAGELKEIQQRDQERKKTHSALSKEAYEKHLARSRLYYHEHKEERRAYMKEYRSKNIESFRERDRIWRANNPEKVKEQARRAYVKRKERETPEKRAQRLAYQAEYRAKKKASKNAEIDSSSS